MVACSPLSQLNIVPVNIVWALLAHKDTMPLSDALPANSLTAGTGELKLCGAFLAWCLSVHKSRKRLAQKFISAFDC